MLVIDKTTVIVKPYDRVHVIPAPKSDPIEKIYKLERDEKGNCYYLEIGERNIDEHVNSFANTSALASVLGRIQFMSPRDKISYLQQTENGMSIDLTALPSDGTAAFIALNKYRDILPDITAGLKSGKTLADILKTIYAPKSSTTTNTESEVTENVET